MMSDPPNRALTIAGSDPTGGAGVQQDLAVFAACGVWGLSAITAITAQDTTAIHRWEPVTADLIGAQIAAVVGDIGVDAAKTGMLGSADAVVEIARAVTDHAIDLLVVDPVLRSTVGEALSTPDLADAIRTELLPRALLITPNVDEALALTGIEVRSRDDQERAGRAMVAGGARAALVKGGHLEGNESVDVLVMADLVREFRAPRVGSGAIHGTGCVLSAAITSALACGVDVEGAVESGKTFLAQALTRMLAIGKGALVIDARGVVERDRA